MTARSFTEAFAVQPLDLDAVERDYATPAPDIAELYEANVTGNATVAVREWREAKDRLPDHVPALVAEVRALRAARDSARVAAVVLENRIAKAHDLALLYSSDAFGYDEIAAALTGGEDA